MNYWVLFIIYKYLPDSRKSSQSMESIYLPVIFFFINNSIGYFSRVYHITSTNAKQHSISTSTRAQRHRTLSRHKMLYHCLWHMLSHNGISILVSAQSSVNIYIMECINTTHILPKRLVLNCSTNF